MLISVAALGIGALAVGLAIVRSLADAQGGRVWAESRPGCGLQVFIALPLARP